MVEYKNAQTFFEQSQLLLQARPSTTRISSKYTVAKPRPASSRTKKAAKHSTATSTTTTTTSGEGVTDTSTSTPVTGAIPSLPKATLILKTYDPVSGTCLKYTTDKQAEVGHLIAGLGRLARDSAGLPPVSAAADDALRNAGAAGKDGTSRPIEVDSKPTTTTSTTGSQPQPKQQQGGGGGNKKKGKRGKK